MIFKIIIIVTILRIWFLAQLELDYTGCKCEAKGRITIIGWHLQGAQLNISVWYIHHAASPVQPPGGVISFITPARPSGK